MLIKGYKGSRASGDGGQVALNLDLKGQQQQQQQQQQELWVKNHVWGH